MGKIEIFLKDRQAATRTAYH